MPISTDEDRVETKVKGMLSISCIISKFLTHNYTTIGFPMMYCTVFVIFPISHELVGILIFSFASLFDE